ncbi:MAG: hypothetical protein JY451_04965 [Erythrobacter sp.]|nr:MAG: hypothetical protein JY451_04965 [Erythrobacter sp.]
MFDHVSNNLPARDQQPKSRAPRVLTMDQSQHVGVQKHGFASLERPPRERDAI